MIIPPPYILPQIQVELYDNLMSNNNASMTKEKRRYGDGKEANMIRDELGDFDLISSEAMKLIKDNFGESLRINELKGIINAIREHLSKKGITLPKLSRNANRSFQLCVKYVQDNLEFMKDVIPLITLYDQEGEPIPVE